MVSVSKYIVYNLAMDAIIYIFIDILKTFLNLSLMVFPFFIIGVCFAATLELFVVFDKIAKYFEKGIKGVMFATILGAVLPGCSCASIPMAEGLKRKGAGLGVLGAFIMVSPVLGPHTVVLTAGLLGSQFAIARVVIGLSGAFILGLLFLVIERYQLLSFKNGNSVLSIPIKPCCNSISKPTFLISLVSVTKKLGLYFFISMAIASTLMTLVPPHTIPSIIGSSGPLAYTVALFAGIPMYVCEAEEIPLTKMFLELGLGKGPSFTFMLASVGTCIPTILMAQKVIGKRATLLYVVYWFLIALISGLLINHI